MVDDVVLYSSIGVDNNLLLAVFKRRPRPFFLGLCVVFVLISLCIISTCKTAWKTIPNRISVGAETVYPFKKGYLWGYVNQSGSIVVPPSFSFANPFQENVACVSLPRPFYWIWPPFECHYKILRRDGTLSENTFFYLEAFCEELQPAQRIQDFWIFRVVEKYYGYTDITGEWKIPPRYLWAGDFCEGLAAVRGDKNLFGFINHDGEYAIEQQFLDAADFSDGIAWVQEVESKKYGAIDKTGAFVISPQYNTRPGCFVSGLAPVEFPDGKEGMLQKSTGNIISAIYDNVQSFHDGRARVCVYEPDVRWGFIDMSGNPVIPPQYDIAQDFSEGLAVVCSGQKWGYVGVDGQVVIPFVFEDWVSPFQNGIAYVNEKWEWQSVISHDIIDKSGRVIYDDGIP